MARLKYEQVYLLLMTIQREVVIKSNKLICVVGATGVGKTALSIKIAQSFDCEIVSADSRQFYRELEIGTAKPDQDELASATHHMVNSLSIFDDYDVRKFELEAIEILNQLFDRNDTAIMVGGSGLFVNAVCHGLDELPQVEEEVRQRLMLELSTKGLLGIGGGIKKC